MKTESKQSKSTLTSAVVPAKPIEPEVVGPTALTVKIGSIDFPAGVETLGERANFLHTFSVEAGKRSTAAAILAGWCLSLARESCAHGMWLDWLEKNVSFSKQTATNYMTIFAQTVGKARANLRRPIPLSTPPTMEELDAAAHDVNGKSLSALYKSTRLIVHNNWGGDRREKAEANGNVVGRPKKDAGAPLAASDVDGELCAEEGRDLLEKLAGWALGADDGFGTLPDRELDKAVKTLDQML